jgi:hypothetical protein
MIEKTNMRTKRTIFFAFATISLVLISLFVVSRWRIPVWLDMSIETWKLSFEIQDTNGGIIEGNGLISEISLRGFREIELPVTLLAESKANTAHNTSAFPRQSLDMTGIVTENDVITIRPVGRYHELTIISDEMRLSHIELADDNRVALRTNIEDSTAEKRRIEIVIGNTGEVGIHTGGILELRVKDVDITTSKETMHFAEQQTLHVKSPSRYIGFAQKGSPLEVNLSTNFKNFLSISRPFSIKDIECYDVLNLTRPKTDISSVPTVIAGTYRFGEYDVLEANTLAKNVWIDFSDQKYLLSSISFGMSGIIVDLMGKPKTLKIAQSEEFLRRNEKVPRLSSYIVENTHVEAIAVILFGFFGVAFGVIGLLVKYIDLWHGQAGRHGKKRRSSSQKNSIDISKWH